MLTYLPPGKAKHIMTFGDDNGNYLDDNDGHWVNMADDEDQENRGGEDEDEDEYKEIDDNELDEAHRPVQFAEIFEQEVRVCLSFMSTA
jgi:hypothetical protein